MDRTQLTDQAIAQTPENFKVRFMQNLMEKGKGTFSSTHEILGVVTEEYNELVDAIYKMHCLN